MGWLRRVGGLRFEVLSYHSWNIGVIWGVFFLIMVVKFIFFMMMIMINVAFILYV